MALRLPCGNAKEGTVMSSAQKHSVVGIQRGDHPIKRPRWACSRTLGSGLRDRVSIQSSAAQCVLGQSPGSQGSQWYSGLAGSSDAEKLAPVTHTLGEGNGTPLQYSCLGNPMDGGAWWAAVYGVMESDTIE